MSVPIVLKGAVLVTNGSALATDSFGITKVAQAFPIFASMSCRGSNTLGMDQTPNVGTSPPVTPTAPTADTSHIDFSNTGATASTYTLYATRYSGGAAAVSAARQGYVYTSYIPGIGKQVMLTGILKSASPYTAPSGMDDVQQVYTRLGLGDDNSGMFWQYDAYTNAVYIVILSKGGYTSYVTQADFNGNNLSALTVPAEAGYGTVTEPIDWTKYQLFYIDYEWLGAGAVRFGVMVNDCLIIAHTVTNFNALTAPYLPIPNWPAHYRATISTPAVGTIQLIEGCCSVSINTPPTWPPQTNTTLSYVSSLPITGGAGPTAILAIRGQQGATPSDADGVRSSITLLSVSIALTTADTIILRVWRCFQRAGVQYGVVTATGGAAFTNPYPLLPSATGLGGTSAPACLVEISDPTIVTTPAAVLTMVPTLTAAPQLIVSTAATSTARFGSAAATAVLGCSMSLADSEAATIFVVTAQNISSGSWKGVCMLDWSQES